MTRGQKVDSAMFEDGNGITDPPAKIVLMGGFQGAQPVQFDEDEDFFPAIKAIQKRRNTDITFSISNSNTLPKKSRMWVSVSLEEAYEKVPVKEGLLSPKIHKKGLPDSERNRKRVNCIVRQIKGKQGAKESIRYQIFDGSDKLEKLIFNNLALRLFLSTPDSSAPECIHLIRTPPFLMYSRRLKPLPSDLLLPAPFQSKSDAYLRVNKEKEKQKKVKKSARIVPLPAPRYSPRLRSRVTRASSAKFSENSIPPQPAEIHSYDSQPPLSPQTKSLDFIPLPPQKPQRPPLSQTHNITITIQRKPLRERLQSAPGHSSPSPPSPPPPSPPSPSPLSPPSFPPANQIPRPNTTPPHPNSSPSPPQIETFSSSTPPNFESLSQPPSPTPCPPSPPPSSPYEAPPPLSPISSPPPPPPPRSPDVLIFQNSEKEEVPFDFDALPPSFPPYPSLCSDDDFPMYNEGGEELGEDFLFDLEYSLVV